MSFGTIVASRGEGAMAHGFPTDKVIENGDMVVVDFGSHVRRLLFRYDADSCFSAIFPGRI